MVSLAGVAAVTFLGYRAVPVNATTIGFAYLLLVLIVATVGGFVEAALASIAATFAYNFYFLPPIGRLTIADPQNWVALFSFLATALMASRLSIAARRRAADALARQRDVERLYTFSRAILLIDTSESFPKQLVRKLAEIFELDAAVLFDRRSDEFYRAGPLDFDGLDDQLRDAALAGTSFSDERQHRAITAIRLGSNPIAGLGLQGAAMPDGVLQGVGNLVAIGLERAHAQDLDSQIEAARQSEKLRTTLLDAMAHEFKTPLTSVMAATTSLLSNPDQPREQRVELMTIADESAKHLKELIDDAVEIGRLDSATIEIHAEPFDLAEVVREVVAGMQAAMDTRVIQIEARPILHTISGDRRLLKLALKQLLDNAFKYSPSNQPVTVRVFEEAAMATVAITDRGPGIAPQDRDRIFDRLYRSPSVEGRIPGSGLGLSIALSIARAHHGDLTMTSRPGETTFSLMLAAGRRRSER